MVKKITNSRSAFGRNNCWQFKYEKENFFARSTTASAVCVCIMQKQCDMKNNLRLLIHKSAYNRWRRISAGEGGWVIRKRIRGRLKENKLKKFFADEEKIAKICSKALIRSGFNYFFMN